MATQALEADPAIEAEAPAPHGRAAPVRRPALPNGRAVLGGFLVAVAGVTAFVAASRSASPTLTTVVVAAEPISPGERLTAASLDTIEVDLPDRLATAVFANPEDLVGAHALGPLGPGEVVQATGIDMSPGTHGLDGRLASVTVPRYAAMHGDLRPGQQVDVLATAGGPGTTGVIIRGAQVVGASGPDDSDLLGESAVELTLSLPDEAALLRLVDAAAAGDLTVVPSGGRPASDEDGTVSVADLAAHGSADSADSDSEGTAGGADGG